MVRAPWDEPSGKHVEAEPVSTRNLRLLNRSLMNRPPGGVEQATNAINACCYNFPAGRSKVMYTFAHYPQIAGGIDSTLDPRSRGPGKGRSLHCFCLCLWNEGFDGFSR